MKYLSFTLLLGCLLQSCGESPSLEDYVVTEEEPIVVSEENTDINQRIDFINNAEKLLVVNSLIFSQEIVNQVSVESWLKDDGSIRKMTEMYQNGEVGDRGVRMFYFDDAGELFCTQERFEDMLADSSLVFREHFTYYENGVAVSSKSRVADYEDYIDQEEFVNAEPTTATPERAFAVTNNTGDYQTFFRNFLQNGDELFLIVGSKEANGYNTALRLDYTDEFAMELYNNQENYKGKKLEIQFEIQEDQNQYQFQVYTGGKWAAE